MTPESRRRVSAGLLEAREACDHMCQTCALFARGAPGFIQPWAIKRDCVVFQQLTQVLWREALSMVDSALGTFGSDFNERVQTPSVFGARSPPAIEPNPEHKRGSVRSRTQQQRYSPLIPAAPDKEAFG